jgi:hypothetical protein
MGIVIDGGDEPDVTLQSPGEALFYGLCWLHQIPAERTRLDRDSVECGDVMYCPGFHVAVPKMLDVRVEIADGDHRAEAVLRPCRAAYRQVTGRHLIVLYREDLDRLRDAGKAAQFVARLKGLNYPGRRHGV